MFVYIIVYVCVYYSICLCILKYMFVSIIVLWNGGLHRVLQRPTQSFIVAGNQTYQHKPCLVATVDYHVYHVVHHTKISAYHTSQLLLTTPRNRCYC